MNKLCIFPNKQISGKHQHLTSLLATNLCFREKAWLIHRSPNWRLFIKF